jgi:SAM-dependent methyltransferase
MSLRFHEIAEANHRIQNPITQDQLLQLGEMCHANRSTRLLDLACGKGELLCQWALHYGVVGVGVDISKTFIAAARHRGFDLAVWDKVSWVEGDAADYPAQHHQFNTVSCLGATWIGGGLLGTIQLMRVALHDDGGTLMIGEPYWNELPPDEAYAALDIKADTFDTLEGTKVRFQTAGVELVDMLLAAHEEWDTYMEKQYKTVAQWLDKHPHDPDHAALSAWIERSRTTYEQYGRPYLGWGVFILRVNNSTS